MGIKKPMNTCPGCESRDRMNGHITRRVEQLERVLVENGIEVPEVEIEARVLEATAVMATRRSNS